MTDQPTPTGLLRRLAACLYDGLLLIAVWMVGTAALLPLTGGEAIAAGNPLYPLYLLLLGFGLLGWPWLRSGRTLGMQAWRLQVRSIEGSRLTWRQVILRYSFAALYWVALGFGFAGLTAEGAGMLGTAAFLVPAIGFLWSLRDPQGRTLHDIAAGTRVVVLPR